MGKIRDGKLLYHLTALQNLPQILEQGLLPRSSVGCFTDVADAEILRKRQPLGLENYVPFHWFCNNPFDGAVLLANPKADFVLIAVRRSVAQEENWQVVPRHPLAGSLELLDYQAGFDAIDWDEMERRDYRDASCKSTCMAECLAPGAVPVRKFFKIYVPHSAAADRVTQAGGGALVSLNPHMFAARS